MQHADSYWVLFHAFLIKHGVTPRAEPRSVELREDLAIRMADGHETVRRWLDDFVRTQPVRLELPMGFDQFTVKDFEYLYSDATEQGADLVDRGLFCFAQSGDGSTLCLNLHDGSVRHLLANWGGSTDVSIELATFRQWTDIASVTPESFEAGD